MKTKYFALAIAPALMLTVAVSADARFGGGEGRGGMKLENVTKSLEKIDDGLIRTLTSTDADTVTLLQTKAAERAANNDDNESYVIVNLSNGVQITNTTDDAEQLAKMHERADKKVARDTITKTVTNLENGVKVTITSTDATVVADIQAKEPRESKNDAVTISQVNISNGVEMTITTTNEAMVERIQNRAEKGGKGKRGGKRGGERGQR